MTYPHWQSYSVEQVVALYVEAKKKLPKPISMTKAIRAIHFVVPQTRLSDAEIADMLSETAIRKGKSVVYDQAGDTDNPVPETFPVEKASIANLPGVAARFEFQEKA